MENASHDGLISVLKKCTSIKWENDLRSPTGDVLISSENADNIQKLMDKAWITSCRLMEEKTELHSEEVSAHLQKQAILEFQLPIPDDNYAIVKNLDALLEYSPFLTKTPQSIYIIQTQTDIIPTKYKDTVSLASLLKMVADYVEESSGRTRCLFYDGYKFSVVLKYSEKDMRSLDGLEEFKESFQKPRLKERIQIFRSSLVKVAISAPSEASAFPHLLLNFMRIKNTFEQDWNLYVSDFSMEEVLDELKEKILKISDKISNSLSDLQKTMIAVPLAIIFAAPKVETSNLQSLSNLFILAGVWSFAILTSVFFFSHKKSIYFIETEIKEVKNFTNEKHKSVGEDFTSKFNELLERCRYQKIYMNIVNITLWAIVLFFSISFLWPQLNSIYKSYEWQFSHSIFVENTFIECIKKAISF